MGDRRPASPSGGSSQATAHLRLAECPFPGWSEGQQGNCGLELSAPTRVFCVARITASAATLRIARAAIPGSPLKRPAVPTICSARLLADWSDGLIEGRYPTGCYRHALKSLPADLRIYSTAPNDIAQALSQQVAQTHTAARTLMGRAVSK
jgi:hypothetical protein